MKKIICCLMAAVMIFMAGCSAQQLREENTDGLSVITQRLDMCVFYGDEKGCYRIISDENNIRLSYIDFETNREELIKEKLEVSSVSAPFIFVADERIYLHTALFTEDSSTVTSTLTHLAPDGAVVSQTIFPENNSIGMELVRDNDFLYTMLYNRDAKIATLIRINKADMIYEMLADFSLAAQIVTVHEDSIIVQNGSKIISYDTVTEQQYVLPVENNVDGKRIGRWYGIGGKLFAVQGNYSKLETFDIPSEVQYAEQIDSPGMLAEFTVGNDCLIPGCLFLYTRSEITNEMMIHYMDAATMKVVKTIKAADFAWQYPVARCGDKLLVVEIKQGTYPFVYEYKVCLLADYLNGEENYTIIKMLDS